MERIKELEKQRDDLRRLVAEVQEQIGKEYTRLATEMFGVKPGSIVKDKGRIFRVTRIETHFAPKQGKPWLMGSPQNKNGNFSKREELVCHWELVE
jgi:adenylate kinase